MELVEEANLLAKREDAKLTVCELLIGRETIVCGDSQGGLRGWFRARRGEQDALGGDGFGMSLVHELDTAPSAVRCFGGSQRSRMFAVGYDDGSLRVYHMKTELCVLDAQPASGEPILAATITPKDDGLVAATQARLWMGDFDPKHPEATLATLFFPVWYEGYSEPKHIWQSSYATMAPEMKFGLWPLVFGTLKATVYTMLFGAPLALLAAVYTSEFMQPRVRAAVKPVIEMMASLPSVVLGFLAALVFAPVIERFVPATLAAFFTFPLAFLAVAHVWQLLPQRTLLRLQKYRFLFLLGVLPLGFVSALLLGPLVEQAFFAGDVMRWLDGQIGNGVGAWLLMWLPLSGFSVVMLNAVTINPWLRMRAQRLSRRQFAFLSLIKFMVLTLATFLLAYGISVTLDAGGWDPRGSYVDTFVQRNALVVGFVMGFAVIPIIYTLADDALRTVPEHLRSASLGCGATPWQTAMRVVVPTAMSGLFSALMIGLGRAVGETMIVLMAGGNTPVTKWNMFEGFRTLSANIAVELPEAVKDSTHFRTLFLAALTLLIMTFFINTLAEIVRLRFRRRAYQL
jgi:phosphate transport system permease protein